MASESNYTVWKLNGFREILLVNLRIFLLYIQQELVFRGDNRY